MSYRNTIRILRASAFVGYAQLKCVDANAYFVKGTPQRNSCPILLDLTSITIVTLARKNVFSSASIHTR